MVDDFFLFDSFFGNIFLIVSVIDVDVDIVVLVVVDVDVDANFFTALFIPWFEVLVSQFIDFAPADHGMVFVNMALIEGFLNLVGSEETSEHVCFKIMQLMWMVGYELLRNQNGKYNQVKQINQGVNMR